ncbi:MAG: ATPase [Pusillimonas sp.]|nr:ATPase [Pusillimonas sp.]MBC43744.1 ATPase [Pusillimonas sp.]HCP78789.1 ATPase [Pusillimonas sp.]|tara:strand:- start:16628 stop:18088 length:1461 start_codon:yes stop_codon:yes gene_type:complete
MKLSRYAQRLVPRSLSTRLILLTLGTLLVVQAATLATVAHFRQKFTEDVTVEVTATTIRTLRASLAQVPEGERAELVKHASRGEWQLWSRTLPSNTRNIERRHRSQDGTGQQRQSPPDDLRRELRNFVTALNTRLDDGTRVGLSRGALPRLYISLDNRLDNPEKRTREWLVIPLDRLSPPVSSQTILAWLGGMGLLLLIAAAFSWHITRPLTRLARAADQLAAGQPRRVTPSGPTETKVLGQRFNAMLDALNESETVKRTLLAGLPHDLKGPLSRMWLRAEMIDDSDVKDGLRKDIQDMQRMVNQFIGFVRGTDPSTYHFSPLNLTQWLDEQINAWETAGSEVRLLTMPQTNVWIQADPVSLGRLIDNLVTNALNHGKPPVEVWLTLEAGTAFIHIRDYGPGIAIEQRTEALRPFSRLDKARTRTGSVGLGLALSDAIARAHGGQLNLMNAEPGPGLEVRISLPVDEKPEVAADATRQTSANTPKY